jgi:diguanylate cyclase (GGDEF)-like protein
MQLRLALATKVQIAFGAVMAVLLIVGVVAYKSVLASAQSAQWAQHTNEVLEHLATLRLEMENLEDGYRDFALSGAEEFLRGSRADILLVKDEQKILRALTADNQRQQNRLSNVDDLLQLMVQRGDAIVRSRRTTPIETAAELIHSRLDDPLLDAFRTTALEIEAEEQQLLRGRNADATRLSRDSKIALIAGSVLALLIAGFSGWRVSKDQTERKQAEDSLKRLNRLYAMVGGINASMVRVNNREELFARACQTAVEQGEFEMAWIAVVDHAHRRIVPVAWAGLDGPSMAAIETLFSSGEGTLQGKTLAAHAIRKKSAIVSNDVQNDESLIFGKMHSESGVRSLAVLPLIISDNAIGVFALYTCKREFFDAAGLELLTELAGNVAFALDHIEKQERLDRFAYYDALTGLANRRSFLDRVTQHMQHAAAEGHRLAVFLVDLERFKKINDSLGRTVGDTLLKQVAGWLTQNAGNVNLVARVDADHFAVVLPKVKHEAEIVRVLEKTIASFALHEFSLNDAVYRMAAKVGVAVFPDDGSDADTLFRNAEAALKKAKLSRDRYLFYAQKMTETVAISLGMENRLRRALEREQFVLHYQPKVDLITRQVTGAEALIRWNDPVAGLTPPGRFIPILEETGLIHDVGRWALRKAVEDYQRWRNAGLPAVRLSVNVSPVQLRNRNFVTEIQEVIGASAHAADGLQLEITESLIMENIAHSITSLLAIRALGVTIAIDDFGTGFSSLSYLAKLPVDTLKIDRSFIVDMASGTDGLTLVSVIINLAHALKLNTVAEGVETEEQLRQLRTLHCDEMQGYLFDKPMPAEAFEAKYLAVSAALRSGLVQ